MTKPRVLEFATYAGIGGTQRMIAECLRHASHERFHYTLGVLLEPGFLTDEADRLGIDWFSLRMRGYWDLSAWWKLYRIGRREHFDLIRSYGLKAHLIGRIVGKLLRIPVNITSVRSTDPWRRRRHVWLDRATSGLTDVYLANSEAGRQVTHRREGIPLDNIITIPNGTDLTRFPAVEPARIVALRQSFGIPENAPVIGIVANFRKMKGHATLVDALPFIRQHVPDIHCLFIGEAFVNEPWYREELERYVRQQALDDVIHFTGARQDIPALLALLDMFVLPSEWEGFPVTILEAMAAKIPVIASRVGGIPEIVEDQQTGLLIPPRDAEALADAVMMLLRDAHHAAAMGQTGFQRVQQHFSLHSVVIQTETLYTQLLEKRKGHS